jgi:diguanylate cyclase (GGDEF)-like protein/putative nucleotidyltransferase with HDIG domain
MRNPPPGKNLTLHIAILFVCAASAAFLAWWLVAHFGFDIAYVVIPFAVIGFTAYRMHLKRLAQKTSQISEASRIHLATVEALATAIDARDQIGVGHVRRTQIYAVGLGRLLGLPASDIDALRTGALLHDIGKLAVPDHILNKAGGLTPAEIEKTKIHSSVGAAILEKVGFDYPVVPTVRSHHENWDGTGYPEGLKGQDIPLTARVLAVADAFDTLRGARPYRDAMPREQARQLIQAEAGTHFDPAIVSTLIRNLALLEQQIDAEGLSYEDTTASDLSHTHNYVEQIKLANREVFSLYELAREFSASLNLNETLDMFTRKVREFVPFSTCALYLLDASKRSAVASHVEGENADLLMLRRMKIGQGATGVALKTRLAVKGVDPNLDFSYSQSELTGRYRSMASVPLIAEDELIGAITIYSKDLEVYGDEHIRLLETISRIAAEAIGKTLKHDETKVHALTDPMTGLPNARNLQMQFEKEAGRAGRGGTSLQLLMLDLDGFKKVNDSFGHKVGDRLLAEIGQVIRGQLRDYDFLARYGGDEFVALVPEMSTEDVVDLCGRIERAVGAYRLEVREDAYAQVGVSLGAAGYPADGETFDQMIVAADKAMYERKVLRKMAADPARNAALPTPLKDPRLIELSVEDDEAGAYDLLQSDPEPAPPVPDSEGFIIELDETHVLSAAGAH